MGGVKGEGGDLQRRCLPSCGKNRAKGISLAIQAERGCNEKSIWGRNFSGRGKVHKWLGGAAAGAGRPSNLLQVDDGSSCGIRKDPIHLGKGGEPVLESLSSPSGERRCVFW